MGIFKKSGEERETMNGEYLVVPYAKEVEAVTRVLSDAGMHIVHASGQKLHNLVRSKTSDDTERESVVYSPPCCGCSAMYYGETAWGVERTLKEHRSYL